MHYVLLQSLSNAEYQFPNVSVNEQVGDTDWYNVSYVSRRWLNECLSVCMVVRWMPVSVYGGEVNAWCACIFLSASARVWLVSDEHNPSSTITGNTIRGRDKIEEETFTGNNKYAIRYQWIYVVYHWDSSNRATFVNVCGISRLSTCAPFKVLFKKIYISL